MSLRSLGCWRSTFTQFNPVSLRSHGCPLPIPQICIGSVTGPPPCETDIKRKLNAIPDSPLAGKTEARGRGGVQKGIDSWRSDLITDIAEKSLHLIMQRRPGPRIHSDSSCSLIYLPAELNVFQRESHFKLELEWRSVTRRHQASATLNLIGWLHNLAFIALVCYEPE